MKCPHCEDGYLTEYREYRMKCEHCDEEGNLLCYMCGDFATRQDTEGAPQCDPCHFAWEREAAA